MIKPNQKPTFEVVKFKDFRGLNGKLEIRGKGLNS